MNFLFCALPLNLSWVEILLHLLNLAILVVAVRFLLYTPIKKFMAKRAAEYTRQDEESQQKMLEAEKLKDEYEGLLAETKQNALQVAQSSTAAAEARADLIVSDAQTKAAEILKKADEEIRQRMEDEAKRLKLSISELAYSMAEEILSREVSQKDLDSELNNIIGKWDNA